MDPGSTSPEPPPEQGPERWQWLREWTLYYWDALLRKGEQPLMTEQNINLVFLTLVLCDALGQLKFMPGGFYAWVRMEPEHLESVGYSRDLDKIIALGREELTTGQVCFVAEVLAETPGQAYRAMRELSRLPGVTQWAAWRHLQRRAGGKIHGRKLPPESAGRGQ